MRPFAKILLILFCIASAGTAFIWSGRRSVRRLHAYHVLSFIKDCSDMPEMQKALDGRMPRTEKEFCEAYTQVYESVELRHGTKASSRAPTSIRQIYTEAQYFEVEWTPQSERTLAQIKDGNTVYSAFIGSEIVTESNRD